MRKIFITLIVVLLFSFNSKAQIENVSSDSIKSLICHKWGVRAIIMSGQEMTNMNETVTYQFFNDNTLQRVTDKKTEKGIWTFDADKMKIIIKIKKTTLYVSKLKQGDLVISPTEVSDSSGNSLGIATALKVVE